MVKAGGSGDAKKFLIPLRAKIGGNLKSLWVLYEKSSLKSNAAAASLFEGDSGRPGAVSGSLGVTVIVVSVRVLLISAEALAKTFTVVVIVVYTILGLTFSSASIVGFL